MYSLNSFDVLYNDKVIQTLERPFKVRDHQVVYVENVQLVLKQKGDCALVHYKDVKDDSYVMNKNPSVYFYIAGKLIKEFKASIYHCNPCVDFIRDYFILYDNEKKLGLYNLDGEFIRKIDYELEMVRGINVIKDDFFIVHTWFWTPFFSRRLYHFDSMMKSSGEEEYVGMSYNFDLECDELKTLSEEEALKILEDWEKES